MVSIEHMRGGQDLLAEGLWLLALTYLPARLPDKDTPVRHDLAWIGGLALIPQTFWVVLSREWLGSTAVSVPKGLLTAGWVIAYGAPLALAYALRGRAAWPVLVAAVWVRLVGAMASRTSPYSERALDWHEIGMYALCGLGSALLAWWGIVESRRERINLGVAGFGPTRVFLYFALLVGQIGPTPRPVNPGALAPVGGDTPQPARRQPPV